MNKFKNLKHLAIDLSVLYCEDEKDIQIEYTKILNNFFHTVETAEDGDVALEKYQEYYHTNNRHFDIVITDLSMPNLDGVGLIKEIKNINQEQSIVVISAYNDSDRLITLLNLGVNSFIEKPIEIDNTVDILYGVTKNIVNAKLVRSFQKNVQDMNEQLELKVKEKTKELYQKLYYDLLTGLPKRNKLFEDIEFYQPSGLLLINIKQFKDINGVYGTKIGDEILKKFSKVLQDLSDENFKLYSIGGDEFVIIDINKTPTPQETTLKAIEITSHIYDNPIVVEIDGVNIEVQLSVTIGIVSSKHEDLLSKADLALKYAVQKRIPYQKYSDELDLVKHSTDDIYWTKEIKKAILEDRVVPYFQPIIMKSGDIKFESLIRIEKDEEVIPPFKFLDVSKRNRQYSELTRIMIRKVFALFEHRDNSFSINLTFEDIVDTKLLEFLINNITQYKVQDRLIIEIVESESIDDYEIVKNFISVMKMMGVRISIDDFGSGYSNFIYLIELKPNFIKIDGSIVKNIDSDQDSFQITQSIVEFAKRLKIQTIAEYVHSKEVYDILKDMDVDGFQGYYISEPLKDIDGCDLSS